MKEILFNIALLDTINLCNKNKIDCSGTHLHKYPRRFTYALVQDTTGKALVSITYYKNRTASHIIH